MDGVLGTGDDWGVRIELFDRLFTMMVGEEESSWEKGEEGEFCFHNVAF